MDILRGYVLGNNLQILLQWYCDEQKVVPKAGKYFGRAFHTEIGVTQEEPLSTTIFSILVYAVVRVVLL